MVQAIKETLDPRGGHGMLESFIFLLALIVVIAVLFFNYKGIEIDPSIVSALSALIGWIVGTNKKEKWDGEERREDKEND